MTPVFNQQKMVFSLDLSESLAGEEPHNVPVGSWGLGLHTLCWVREQTVVGPGTACPKSEKLSCVEKI